MTQQGYTVDELMDLLVQTVGLPQHRRTSRTELSLSELGLDSLAFLELHGQLAQRFGVELSQDHADRCTVGDVLAAVRRVGAGANA
jgi:minimal PKS acyl carrier protein